MIQHKRGIPRMPACCLIDQKCIGDQNSLWSESANEIWKQSAIEKVHIDDCVERFLTQIEVIQIRKDRRYREVLGASGVGECAHRLGGKIDSDDADSGARERDRIAAAATGDVECESARDLREHLD